MVENFEEKGWNPIFKDLFILDMANNHQGSVEHGLNIIREVAEVAKANNAKVAIKFQYRDLDTFVHPDFVNDKTNKHIPRFMSTRLKWEEFEILIKEARKLGLLTACTPFDENSVDVIERHGFDIIKIASCSARDKPLLQRVAKAQRPIVCSTAGASMKDIDYVAHLFESNGKDFALMHCVALYPTPNDKLQLNQIDFLRHRYNVPVGFSTHEDPNDTSAVQMAIAKGAQLLERHVGKETETVKLNAYSSTKERLDAWMKSAVKARQTCGHLPNRRAPHPEDELESLRSLERGVYVKSDVKKGSPIKRDDVFFAMPRQKGQLSSGDFRENIIANHDYQKNKPVDAVESEILPEEIRAYAIQEAKSLLRAARIPLGNDYEAELSHHYGIRNMLKTGLIMINCMNRDYCKKLLIQLPGQMHPEHYHQKKEESFQILYGVVDMVIDGTRRRLHPGDKLLIEPGQKHSFSTETGAVIEEVSTKYEKGGSVYTDPAIFSGNPDDRKTYLKRL